MIKESVSRESGLAGCELNGRQYSTYGVLGVLGDFHLLHLLTQGGTISIWIDPSQRGYSSMRRICRARSLLAKPNPPSYAEVS